MTGFYKDYADSSDTHQNSAEASADAAEVSANEAATSASEAATSASQAAASAAAALVSENNASDSEAAALASQSSASTYADDAEDSATQAAASATAASNSATTAQNLEITSASFDTTDGTLTLTKANSGTVTTDFDGRYAELTGATFTGDINIQGNLNLRDADRIIIGDTIQDLYFSYRSDLGFGLVSEGTELRLRAPTVKLMSSGDVFLLGEDDTNGNPKVSLNYNNSERLVTTSGGIDVTGDITLTGTVDGVDIATVGANYITASDITGKANLSGADFTGDVTTTGDLGINTTNPAHPLDVKGNVNVTYGTDPIYTTSPLLSSTTLSIAEITDVYYASIRSASGLSPVGTWDSNRRAVQILFNFNGTGHPTAGEKGWTSSDPSVVSTFINDNYSSGDISTFNSSVTAIFNGTYTIQTTIIDDILDGDYDHLVDYKVGINVDPATEALDVGGNIKASGTLATGGFTLPSTDGTNGQALLTDGNGAVSWGNVSVDLSTYATESYVDTAVSNLVDSAPATLDTLNELASALGDDSNFSTTVTNSLAGKADLSGADFTGDVTTTGKVGIGTTNPTHTLDVAGQIQSDDAIHIQGTGYARLEVGGGTGAYLDLKTPNSDDFDFRMIHDSAGSKFISPNADVKFDVGGSLKTIIKADGKVGIGTPSPATNLHVAGGNSGTNQALFRTTSGGGGGLQIVCSDLSLANPLWSINTFYGEALAFGDGTNEHMRIDSSGNVGIGTNNPITPLQVNGTIYAEGGTFDPPDDGTPPSGSDTITNVAFAMPRDNKIGFWHDGYFRTLLHQDAQGVTQIGQLATSYITGIKLNCGASGSATIKNSNGNAGLTVEGSLTSSNITYPTTDGTNGQVIVTDGSGNLSFGDATANLSGKADLSGATFTGNVFVEKEYPTLSQLFTTSRTPEELANWARYLVSDIPDGYSNADPNYRDALDTNQDGVFSSSDVYAINIFVANNYNSTDESTYTNIVNGTNPDNSTFVTDVLNGEYNTGTFSTDITNNRVGINTVNPNATLDVNGDIAVSGTVDGVDIATLNSTVAGKADLSGATFTGNVVIGIPPSGTQSLTVAGATNLYDDLSLNNNDITNSGSISATQLTVGANGISSTGGITASTATVYGNVLQSGGNITCGNNLNVTGNITVGGTVDGRDVAADGTKLDSVKGTLTHNYWDGMQWSQGANRALTTTLTQYGDTQFVKHSGDTYKTYVDLSVDLLHNSTSGTNDAYCHLAVIAPLPSAESTINMGTCTLGTSGVSYIQQFTISGDWTEYFSPYIGISKNSDGSSPMSHPYKWSYNAYSNRTTVWVSLYTNAPSNGDTIYLHPFDWESSGTVINGELLRLDGSSDTAVDNRRDFKIYLGRFDSRVGYRFLARENSSTDVVSLDTLRMSTTEYEA